MKKNNRKKKWKSLFIFIWLLFLAAASIGCIILQRAMVVEKAKTELTSQAEIISRQFAGLVDTDFEVRSVLSDRLIPEAKAISFVLENYDDIDQANAFLEDIVNATEVKKLWIYDREGNVLFGSGDAPENMLEPEYITYLLDSKAYELIESNYDENEKYWTTTYVLEESNNYIIWGVKDRWLVYAEDIFSDTLKDVVQFFDWDHVLQKISICRDGVVLAVSESEGCVLSYPDPSAKGKPVTDLNISITGKNEAAGVDQLLDAFSDTGEVKEIEVDAEHYYAARMNIDNDLFLVMFPEKNIEKEVYAEALVLMVPLLLITGIGVLYVFCLAAGDPEQLKNGGEKKRGGKVLIGKLKVFTIAALIVTFIISLYLEANFVYARMFRYTGTTAERVMQIKHDTDEMLKEIQTWEQQGNLEKCRIARCCVQHAAKGKVDRQYVSDLADRLNVSSLYVFDKQGKVSCTNAPYDGYIIDKDSPFHALLEGAESVTLDPDQEETSKAALQEAGVTMIDESNRVAGAIVIADSIDSMIPDDMSFDNVFQRVFLKDNTSVMAIDSANMTVQYFAQLDGSLLVSDRFAYDYSQTDAAAWGLDENLIRDHFNGEMFALDNQYFASVRRSDNAFLIVMMPLVFIDAGNLLSVIYVTLATFLFFILLLFVIGKSEKIIGEGLEEVDDQEAEKKKPKRSAQDKDAEEDDVITLLGRLTNREKWGFEERWPSDGKKWREKTPMERFSAAVKLICVLAIVLPFAYVAIAEEDSILYYCLNGEWSTGINLYSITQSIICIFLLILMKEIIHKVLYLIARAAESKGETICQLLNSFTGYVLFIAGVFIILGLLGVDVTAMSLTAGVAGVIFGIGCQNIVADILAGLIMAFEGVACAGDFVSFNGQFGTIQSIGVRTTKLKWFSEVTIVRNNEFKNYINMPAEETDRVVVYLSIDLKETLSRVESVIEKELPQIRERISERIHDTIKLKYRGVQSIEESGIKLSFAVYCQGMYYGWTRRLLSRELLLMCERNAISLAMPQIVINEREDVHKDSDVHGES